MQGLPSRARPLPPHHHCRYQHRPRRHLKAKRCLTAPSSSPILFSALSLSSSSVPWCASSPAHHHHAPSCHMAGIRLTTLRRQITVARWCLLVLSTLVRPRNCCRRWLSRARDRSSTRRSATLSPLPLGPWHTRTQDRLLRWRFRTKSWQKPCSYHLHPIGGTSLTGQLAEVRDPTAGAGILPSQ